MYLSTLNFKKCNTFKKTTPNCASYNGMISKGTRDFNDDCWIAFLTP